MILLQGSEIFQDIEKWFNKNSDSLFVLRLVSLMSWLLSKFGIFFLTVGSSGQCLVSARRKLMAKVLAGRQR